MRTLSGISISPGIVDGPVLVFRPQALPEPPRERIPSNAIATEIRMLKGALAQTRIDLEIAQERFAGGGDSASASNIFHAHLLMLADPSWLTEIKRLIEEEHLSAPSAVHEVTVQYAQRFEAMDNPYLAEKAIDLRDVARRLLSHLDHTLILPIAKLSEPTIIVAKSMMPSDMVHLDRQNTLAIVTEDGGIADHVAIVTRALAIPGITGVRDITEKVATGEVAVVDGVKGKFVIDPTPGSLGRFRKAAVHLREQREALVEIKDLPAITTDNHRVNLWANVGDIEDVKAARAAGAEAIGLFRTELAFLTSSKHPTEAQQLATYRAMAEAADGMALTVRTLDLGGDKRLLYEGTTQSEANPLMGMRGIRRSLTDTRVFRRQLRALLRLGRDHDVRILLPMVVGVRDVVRSIEEIKRASEELTKAGHRHRPDLPVGVMVETPAAVLILEDILPLVDFVSVGTNDLIQYLLVADRQDSRLRDDYTLYHPAVIRSLERIAQVCTSAGKQPCLCGELAGFEDMSELLLGLGFSTLSMAPAEILTVKKKIRSLSMNTALRKAKQMLKHGSRSAIENSVFDE